MGLTGIRKGALVALGEVFRLRPGCGVHLPEAWFQLEGNKPSERVAILCRDDRRIEASLSRLPLQVDRCRVELVEDHGDEASFRSVEASVDDAAFSMVPSFASGRTPVTPERPRSEWRGVRIAAPGRVNLATVPDPQSEHLNRSEPVAPKVIVAGLWVARKADLVGARRAYWATGISPSIVVTDLRRAHTTRQLVDELYDAHLHRVEGLSISWAQPPESPDCDQEAEPDATIGGVFHADIGLMLAPLPGVHPYRVYAEIGSHRSETVEIVLEGT